MPTHARERLLATAERLFYAEGIHAVGVERLLTTSGVGRASFYRHFTGKDELVTTMLTEYDARYRAWLAERVEALGGGPLAVFDALAERADLPDNRGCAFTNAMAEIGDPTDAVYQLASAHKTKVTAYVAGLLAEAGYADHARLAEEFMLLMDGSTATALRERSPASALRAKAIARALLAASESSPARSDERAERSRPGAG